MNEIVQILLTVAVAPLIAALTALIVSRRQLQHGYRFAALDKRLEAHQEAYYYWSEMMRCKHPEKSPERIFVSERCRTWLLKNALYLEPRARAELDRCQRFATVLDDEEFLSKGGPKGITREGLIKAMERTGPTIEDAVHLPTFGKRRPVRTFAEKLLYPVVDAAEKAFDVAKKLRRREEETPSPPDDEEAP